MLLTIRPPFHTRHLSARTRKIWTKNEIIDSFMDEKYARRTYEKIFKKVSSENTQFLKYSATIDPPKRLMIPGDNIPSTVSVKKLGFPVTKALRLFALKETSDDLYIRDFYPQLLACVRSKRKAILTGDHGIGKSWFQLYYLLACVNPAACGLKALPPNHNGSTEPPEVIIRQVGITHMFIYFLKAQVVHLVSSSMDIFDCFDLEKVLYLYEPMDFHDVPYCGSLQLQTLITCAPPLDNYKYFFRHMDAACLYMPPYELDELRAVGKHIQGHLYNDVTIRRGFREWGGRLRYVIPDSEYTIDYARQWRAESVRDTDIRALLFPSEFSGSLQRSDLLTSTCVPKDKITGMYNFLESTTQLMKSIRPLLMNKLLRCSLEQVRDLLLMRNKNKNRVNVITARDLFEIFLAKWLTQENGLSWQCYRLPVTITDANDRSHYRETIKVHLPLGVNRTRTSFYSSIEAGTLYYPERERGISRFADMFFRIEEDGPLYCIKIASDEMKNKKNSNKNKKENETIPIVTYSSYKLFVEGLGIPWNEADQIRYIYCLKSQSPSAAFAIPSPFSKLEDVKDDISPSETKRKSKGSSISRKMNKTTTSQQPESETVVISGTQAGNRSDAAVLSANITAVADSTVVGEKKREAFRKLQVFVAKVPTSI